MKLPQKQPAEIKTIVFRFDTELATGETMTAVDSVTVTTTAGTDAAPSAILSGSATINNPTKEVWQRVTGGLADCDYLMQCLVTGSTGLKHLIAATLPVREAT